MMTSETILFVLFAGLTCGGALGVVICQNIVRMAFCLIVSLGSTAGLFFLLGADFVGATQLLVYVGGTLVLLIFGVMLTASGPFQRIKLSPGETALGAGVGLLFLSVIAFTVITVDWGKLDSAATREVSQQGDSTRAIGLRLIGLAQGSGGDTGYLLPFEIVSVHLLVVLIGAAYLARAKRQAAPATVEKSVSEDEG